MSEEAQNSDFVLPIGMTKIEHAGKDVTTVSLCRCIGQSLVAAKNIKKEYGVECEVVRQAPQC